MDSGLINAWSGVFQEAATSASKTVTHINILHTMKWQKQILCCALSRKNKHERTFM